ncbi:von Willebrand factor D and EGF domain-containing protein-like [Argopecten irradians]|uniref:von Willebrand factor D and EGF domain-containing protein-like n=1 Tax=Argopecten irradians TaxID=31199 RepID=UPI00371E63A0
MKQRLYLEIVLIVVCIYGVCANGDPCFSFLTLNDSTRLSSYESDGVTESPSDRLLTPGWYRNIHPTEGDMMTVCPNATQCGTNFPVWINGTLPNRTEIVTLRACKTVFGMCCGSQFDIKVKGCAGYNVYELAPMTTNTGRYCFYGPDRCPPGQTSPTGFQPCSSSSISFNVSPRVSAIIPSHVFNSPERQLTFTCTGVSTSYSAFLFDITWEVEGREVKRVINVAFSDILTVGNLIESEWSVTGYKIGMHVKCAVRARQRANDIPTQFKYSASFFAGFKVLTPSLTVSGGATGNVKITSTVPIACAHNTNGLRLPCFIRLEMFDFNAQVGFRETCQRNITKLEKKASSCGIKFDGWRWNSQYSLPVTTLVDQSFSAQYTAVVKLRALANDIDHLWDDHVIPDIKIVVTGTDSRRRGKRCRAYNDPQLISFDGTRRFLGSVGEFVLYKHNTKPYTVHIITKNDRSSRYANCGVSVQAGADIFIIYGCDYRGKWIQKRFCTGDSQRLEVYDKNAGKQFEIHLPTGTRVVILINSDFLNVDIFISPSEWMNTKGLCGSFNGIASDDFADRAGNVVIASEYEKAWSVQSGESLFVEKSRTAKLDRHYYFCSCVGNISSNDPVFSQSTDCSWQEGTQLCPPLTWDARACDTRQKRTTDNILDDETIDVPLDIIKFQQAADNVDTWKNDWNETSARAFCTTKIMGVSSLQSCRHLVNPDDSIDMCVTDIKISGESKYLPGAVESFQSLCSNEIRLNTSLWVPAAPGQKSPAEEIEALQCPGECEHDGQSRGACTNGVCHCFANFDGPDCSIDLLRQPTLFPPATNNICDK